MWKGGLVPEDEYLELVAPACLLSVSAVRLLVQRNAAEGDIVVSQRIYDSRGATAGA